MIDSNNILVLFEDSALLVINKPAGLATLPDGYNPSLPHIKLILEQRYGTLWIVHRLDKETSGVLLLARSAEAHRSLNTQFEQHQVAKVYHALVIGNPDWQEKTIDLPLRANGDRSHRTIIDLMHGKLAVTHLKILERYEGYAFVEAIPETGRTHQIRAHLAAVGLAIVGDKLYGRKALISEDGTTRVPLTHETVLDLAGRMGLHARSLEITHPTTGEKLMLTAPYPEYFLSLLEQLRSKSTQK